MYSKAELAAKTHFSPFSHGRIEKKNEGDVRHIPLANTPFNFFLTLSNTTRKASKEVQQA
jgi:hypothetical protein